MGDVIKMSEKSGDNRDGMYLNGFYASNISSSEMIALCEVHKADMIRMIFGD